MTFPEMPLAQVASVRMGSPAPQGEEYFSDTGKPFVRVQDVGRVKRTLALIKTKDRINDHAINTLRPAFAKKGTIVFPKSGAAISTNSRAILGVDAYVVSHLAMVEATPGIADTEWLYFYLCTIDMGQFSRTAALPSLRLSELADLPVPIPPLPEQRRIVSRIKECMERVEEIEGLRRSAIQEASDIEFACFHDALLQGANEKGWPLRTLGDVAKSFRYGSSEKAHVEPIGVPVLRMGNIQRGYMNYSDLKYIEMSGTELDRYRLMPGDILINRTNSLELVGKAAMRAAMAEPELEFLRQSILRKAFAGEL